MNFRNYYRRPRETHRCGLSTVGRACVHGPHGSRCGQSREDTERCLPVRTFLGWARLASVSLTALALSTLCYWFAFAPDKTPIAPGGLSKAHAQLLVSGVSDHPFSIDDERRCAACHPNALPSNSTLLASNNTGSLDVKSADARKQSELCMNCHFESMPNGIFGNPHDLVGEDLKALLASASDRGPTHLARDTTECSQCHREHQGVDGQLQVITSAKCQACHRNQFESFTQGHPEFDSYPPNKPRSIGFDHARHAELHFSKKGKSFDCRSCHVDGERTGVVGSVFRSVSFEQACAECHREPLKSAGIEGFAVFQIPSLDRERLSNLGHDIGPWPESASLLMDGELSPLLFHMLRSSDDGRSILERLPASRKLKDVNLEDAPQRDAIVSLAGFVRQSWQEIASEGQPILRNWLRFQKNIDATVRVGTLSPHLDLYARFVSTRVVDSEADRLPAHPNSSGEDPKEAWMNQLARGIPPDLIRAASQKWFSRIENVIHKSSDDLSVKEKTEPQDLPKITFGSFYGSNDPRPKIGSKTSSTSPVSLRLNPLIGQNEPQDDDDLLTAGDDDLLSDLRMIPQNALESAPSHSTDQENPLKPWKHLPYGGWMIDENRVALVYVPTGHADPWVARWIEWNTLAQDELGPVAFQDAFLKQCVQCHSFDQSRIKRMFSSNTSNVVRNYPNLAKIAAKPSYDEIDDYCWRIEQRPNAVRELTKFDHTPHLSINSLRDCQVCHKLKKLNQHQRSEQGWSENGRTVRSEFEPIQKNQCATCHTKQSAGDACTQCHNYHVHGLSVQPN